MENSGTSNGNQMLEGANPQSPDGTYTYDYDNEGNQIASNNPAAVDHLFGYTGREWDDDVDLQYNRARWYDPAQGRWLSQDPIGFNAGDANLYRYVGNGPTNATDPSGLAEGHHWIPIAWEL